MSDDGVMIEGLVPHAGAMVLLDGVVAWDAGVIRCSARSHLDGGNPLRRAGRLGAVCGVEYGLQAAAVHGALREGGVQAAGYVARLRDVVLHVPYLDEAGFGVLTVEAALLRAEGGGMVYALRVMAEDGRVLVEGGATIALPAAVAAA